MSAQREQQKTNRRGLGIAFRTAAWSWAVTLVTLLTFALAIFPLQKRMYEENLESKARSVALSLRDIGTGAVVNEDFSTVVDYCKEMLKGDPALEYLIVTKNDGLSLINHRAGWRLERNAGPEWRPAKRVTSSGIGIVPLFQKRVYYYSQPLNYSGIEWGWIHVGLSLESYDRGIASLYHRTLALTIGCVLLSLLASVFYARRLVRPILSLRNVVQRVAGGDLAVRAHVDRSDELGILSASVNTMTETLLRRDRILGSVRFAGQQFLSAADWKIAVPGVLAQIGEASGVSRVCLFANDYEASGSLVAHRCHEWISPTSSKIETGSRWGYSEAGLARWAEVLSAGQIMSGLAREMPGAEPLFLERCAVRSLMAVPIHVEGKWWGFLALADSNGEHLWTESERDSMRAAADMLGAAIARQQAQDALIEAKETLEERVRERTSELQEQVLAKARAHAQLAEAQHQVMDASRRAGMAEVATGVLHNVGNVLNSVNVSVNLLDDQVRRSKIITLRRAVSLMQEHHADLAAFLTSDPKGRRVLELFTHLATALEDEQEQLLQEMQSLLKNVEHIKEIVAMQQSYAKVAGVTEDLPPSGLVDDAIHLNEASLLKIGAVIKREFEAVPPVRVDKHKVLQILVNLLRNAKYAMNISDRSDKQLTVRIWQASAGRVRVSVQDNGVGIAAENLTRIFAHGFTTKKDGHGFGLHSGALAAKEMGGSLRAFSGGVGRGATFVLELPAAHGGSPEPEADPSI